MSRVGLLPTAFRRFFDSGFSLCVRLQKARSSWCNVQNQANSGNGLWNAGPNTIESHSNTVITVVKGGQILATGNASNGEAVNFIGLNNTLINYGLVQSRTGAAIWFQDTIVSQSNSNTVDNYGTVRTLKGSNSSAIGNSGNNGVVFINRTGALVDGGLSFAGGNDKLTFEADSKVTGAINGGGGTNALTLQGAAGSNDSLAGAIQNFTTLDKDGQGTWTITGSLSGFTVVSVNEGTLRLTGNNTNYNGSVKITAADAVLEAKARSLPTTGSNIGNIANDGILRLVDSLTDDDGGIGNYAGQITGTGRVEMTGTGIVTLENTNNTYRGGTYVKNGTLGIATMATLGTGGLVLGASDGGVNTVGTLRLAPVDPEAVIDITKNILIVGGGGVIDTFDHDGIVSGAITGGQFTKAGEGTLTLTGNNTYTGGTYITGGTLQIGDGGTGRSSSVTAAPRAASPAMWRTTAR